MRNRIITAIALATTVAAGAFAGYKIATDDELRGRLLRYLSRTHGNIFCHNIHFLLGCIDNILRTTKQTTSKFIVCRGWCLCWL